MTYVERWCCRANAQYHRDDLALIEETEWLVFLQGNIMANMLSEEQAKKHDGTSPVLSRLALMARTLQLDSASPPPVSVQRRSTVYACSIVKIPSFVVREVHMRIVLVANDLPVPMCSLYMQKTMIG